MTTITRKQILTTMYLNFEKELSDLTNDKFLPSLDDIDITDILFYLNYYFSEDKNNYDEELINLIELNGIKMKNNDLKVILQVCNKYLINIKLLLRKL